ncbi:MAG: hypothetical protein LW650_09675 [Planctomycetaceae bacterium]|jgi:flagellar assembly protein FliH|nr:hypothetical protein [Phycisphaerales bacterium]MCE2653736.1 hypothetical protein [Planctomycetaceae bacterium]
MGLLKANQAQNAFKQAVALDLGDLRRQGEMVVAAAQRQASEVLAAAAAERKRLISDAARLGRTEGITDGLAEGHRLGAEQGRKAALAENAELLRRIESGWSAALAEFETRRTAMVADARRDLVRLAVLLAERITKRAVAADPSIVNAQLESVLTMVLRATRLIVRVHPDDKKLVAEALPGLMSRFTAVEHVELLTDPALGRGSCVARLADSQSGSGMGLGGELDASIATQLQRITEALLPDAPPAAPPASSAPPSPAGGKP